MFSGFKKASKKKAEEAAKTPTAAEDAGGASSSGTPVQAGAGAAESSEGAVPEATATAAAQAPRQMSRPARPTEGSTTATDNLSAMDQMVALELKRLCSVPEVADDEEAKLLELFKDADLDGSDTIDPHELKALLKSSSFGQSHTAEKLEAWVDEELKHLPTNKHLEFEEFIQIYNRASSQLGGQYRAEDLRKLIPMLVDELAKLDPASAQAIAKPALSTALKTPLQGTSQSPDQSGRDRDNLRRQLQQKLQHNETLVDELQSKDTELAKVSKQLEERTAQLQDERTAHTSEKQTLCGKLEYKKCEVDRLTEQCVKLEHCMQREKELEKQLELTKLQLSHAQTDKDKAESERNVWNALCSDFVRQEVDDYEI